MRTQRTLWLLAVTATLTGCRSNASTGWTVWNPLSAWGKETAVANAEPTLPSQKIAAATKSAAPAAAGNLSASPTVAAAPKYTPPAAVARTAAATPTMPSYSPGTASAAPAYASPTARHSTPAIPASNSLVSGMSAAAPNSTGPYNPNGYQPAAPVAAAETPAAVNRYGMPDRYASSTPAPASTAPNGTPGEPATPSYSTGGRYAGYETPATPVSAAAPIAAAAPQQVAPASATVNLANPPGYYRPAGTSSYPATGSEQVNVASLPEKPASTPPTNAAPAEAVSPYPSTGAPAPGSVYGAPSYR